MPDPTPLGNRVPPRPNRVPDAPEQSASPSPPPYGGTDALGTHLDPLHSPTASRHRRTHFMTDLVPAPRRRPSIRIDTFRNRVQGTIGLLQLVAEHLEDLHVLAYDRHRAGQAQRVAGGELDYALDTHGDPRARELWQTSALRVLDNAEDLNVVLHEVIQFFSAGQTSARRDATADASLGEVLTALAAQRRRRDRGEFSPTLLVAQPRVVEPDSVIAELELLRSAVRKVQAQITDGSRLTPTEHDALRRAVDPSFSRSRKGKGRKR